MEMGMCLAPTTLPNGVVIPCHVCKQCRINAIYDWVGRNLAESLTAKGSHCIDLTYGRGEAGEVLHERAVLLTFSDVQKWIKLWRRHGYKLRYFVTGEFGSANGRAHWHAIVHWQDKVPTFQEDKRIMAPHWEHGFSYVRKANFERIRYVCKYIQKGQGEIGGFKVIEPPRMSKKPPLGTDYFDNLAYQYVKQGIAPQDLRYTFPGVRTKAGERERPVYFRLMERSAELFLEAYLRWWGEVWPGRARPASEIVDLFESYGRIIYDESLIGRAHDWRDYGNRPVELEVRKMREVPDDVREEQLRAAQSRGESSYWNHKWKWLDEGDVEREVARMEAKRHGEKQSG